MREAGVWGVFALVGLILVIAGFQGSLGRLLACILTPALLTVD